MRTYIRETSPPREGKLSQRGRVRRRHGDFLSSCRRYCGWIEANQTAFHQSLQAFVGFAIVNMLRVLRSAYSRDLHHYSYTKNGHSSDQVDSARSSVDSVPVDHRPTWPTTQLQGRSSWNSALRAVMALAIVMYEDGTVHTDSNHLFWQRIQFSKISLPSRMQSAYCPLRMANSASSKEYSNLPFSSEIRKISCRILHMRCCTASLSWLVLYSVRISSAHSSSMIQCEKLSYQNRLTFSPTLPLSKCPQKVARRARISAVSLATSARRSAPSSVFMKSMTSLEEISALQMLKGLRMGYLLMKLSTFTRSMQYFLQMRKFSSSHSSVTASKRVLSKTNWLSVCRMRRWTRSLSPVPAPPLPPPTISFKKERMPPFVWFMLSSARLRLISSRILLARTEMSMLDPESLLFRKICWALRQERLRSG